MRMFLCSDITALIILRQLRDGSSTFICFAVSFFSNSLKNLRNHHNAVHQVESFENEAPLAEPFEKLKTEANPAKICQKNQEKTARWCSYLSMNYLSTVAPSESYQIIINMQANNLGLDQTVCTIEKPIENFTIINEWPSRPPARRRQEHTSAWHPSSASSEAAFEGVPP